MEKSFLIGYIKRLSFVHRFIYIPMIIYVLLIRVSENTKSDFLVSYYAIIYLACLVLDELLFYKNISLNNKVYMIKNVVQIVLLSVGCYDANINSLFYVSVILIQLMLSFEFIVFGEIFDKYSVGIRRAIAVIGVIIGTIGYFRKNINNEWMILEIFIALLLFGIIYFTTDYYISSIKCMDDKATDIYFENTALQDKNKELLIYQEKVRNVNSEINFQKITLAKVNYDLEKMNKEINNQVEILKYFSSSFDVPQNINYLTDTIMEISRAGMCAFYIDKDVFMNKHPLVTIKYKISAAQKKTNKYISKVYEMMKEKNTTEPFVLVEKYNVHCDYFADTNICDAVAFPAYIGDEMYGIMIVASKNEDFFERGYTYYESAIIEFSISLKSTILYNEMQDIARKDGLTGLFNRVYFNDVFSKACKKAKEENSHLSVALFDIDKFKNVNDTYGHLAGDEVIKLVADIDKEFAEEYNGIACRFGGEEFLLILPDTSCEVALSILETLHEKVRSSKVEYEGNDIEIDICIGLSSFPETCNSVDMLINHADEAMYYGKVHGRGRLVVDSEAFDM